jgi:hypothetical protein
LYNDSGPDSAKYAAQLGELQKVCLLDVQMVIAEIMFWGIESFLLHGMLVNQLILKKAVLLSLVLD